MDFMYDQFHMEKVVQVQMLKNIFKILLKK